MSTLQALTADQQVALLSVTLFGLLGRVTAAARVQAAYKATGLKTTDSPSRTC